MADESKRQEQRSQADGLVRKDGASKEKLDLKQRKNAETKSIQQKHPNKILDAESIIQEESIRKEVEKKKKSEVEQQRLARKERLAMKKSQERRTVDIKRNKLEEETKGKNNQNLQNNPTRTSKATPFNVSPISSSSYSQHDENSPNCIHGKMQTLQPKQELPANQYSLNPNEVEEEMAPSVKQFFQSASKSYSTQMRNSHPNPSQIQPRFSPLQPAETPPIYGYPVQTSKLGVHLQPANHITNPSVLLELNSERVPFSNMRTLNYSDSCYPHYQQLEQYPVTSTSFTSRQSPTSNDTNHSWSKPVSVSSSLPSFGSGKRRGTTAFPFDNELLFPIENTTKREFNLSGQDFENIDEFNPMILQSNLFSNEKKELKTQLAQHSRPIAPPPGFQNVPSPFMTRNNQALFDFKENPQMWNTSESAPYNVNQLHASRIDATPSFPQRHIISGPNLMSQNISNQNNLGINHDNMSARTAASYLNQYTRQDINKQLPTVYNNFL
jgi:hypothetical protein